ncbi:cupin domain-containing protein [Gulosibacter molinativorax]|uniref:Cupin domain-containing protein n=1 Tax=Gulosibacter molinativorax TaxID=256821 RepID=A0ABT7CBI9_9MICO|nr:cupin domain-containing protein [Gulosibacter molinativorax]MDJ1372495.1 cupin domain-containing protein [Gulosibacter molinativorax]QUY61927.1 Hypotetical protein [Gulosibacter molinativorax]
MTSTSRSELQLENNTFRVTKWIIDPGGVIPMHRHDYPYVVVPLMTGSMTVTMADGTVLSTELEAGASYTRPAGGEHEVANHSEDVTVEFVEIEWIG